MVNLMLSKGAEEARNQLPDLLEAAEKGLSTIITRHGRPVAALVPIEAYGATVRQPPLRGRIRSRVVGVLTGPIRAGQDALAQRYRAILESWQLIALDVGIAESAARLRASLRLKLTDAVQAAIALAINAAALVTHDRDFSRVRSLRVIS
jgi:prevent-host-death family protein